MSAHPRGRESSLGPGEDNWTFQWSLWAKALRDIENTDTCECVHIYWDMRCQSNLHWLFRECCYLMRTQTLSNNKNDRSSIVAINGVWNVEILLHLGWGPKKSARNVVWVWKNISNSNLCEIRYIISCFNF